MKISRFNRILALLLVLALAFSDCNIPGVKAEEISAQTEEDAQYTESSEEGSEEESAEEEETTENDASGNDESEDASETVEPADEGGSDEAEAVEENTEAADEGGSDEAEAVEENTEAADEGGSDEAEAVEENTEAADEGGNDETEAVEENTEPADEGGNDEAEAVEGNTEPADEDEQLPEPGQGKVDIEGMLDQTDANIEDSEIMPVASDEEGGYTTLDMSQYSGDLYIYNYLSYTNASGVIQSGAAAYRITGSANQSIFIGDAESYKEDSEYRPLEQDITISVDELQMKENTAVTIRKVYGGSQKVILNVDQASQIEALSIEDGAALELNLDADISIQSLALGKDSSLTVHTNGYTCTVSGDIYGTGAAAEDGELPVSGAVRVTGTGTVSVAGDFAASELNIENASVTAANLSADGDMNLTNAVLSTAGGNGSVTAGGNITVNGSTVKDAALFGYGEDAEGEKTITFSGSCTLLSAAVVGASENCGAKVTIVGSDNIGSSTNTAYICDYKITYLEEETELQPGAEWPVSYRVRHGSLSGSDRTILGSHTADSVYSAAEGNTVTLPVYTKEGYGYAGWLTEESGEPVLELKDQTGMLTLTAVLTAGDVTAVLDLGYEPNENTNDPDENGDRPERYTALEGTKLGDVLTLETPSRFGYNFKGWKAITGSQNKIYTDSYTVSLADLDVDSETSAYKLTLEAQWEAEAFPLRLVLSSQVPAENVEISVDGGSSWKSLDVLGDKAGFAWDASSKTLSFSENIAYGQSLGAYFKALGCTYPVLRDTRAASVREKFITWITTNGTAVTEESCYSIEEGGILEDRGSGTLADYQARLLTNPVMLTTQWGEMEYTITTDKADGWTILVNGEEMLPDEKGQITVPAGALVSWQCSANAGSGVNIGTWKFAYVEDEGLKWINPVEREYSSGDRYLYYDFTMPTADVAAACSNADPDQSFGSELLKDWADKLGIELDLGGNSELWINLADSPITFAEGVSYNHRQVEGFWYEKLMTQMTPLFAVTSDGSQTNDMSDETITEYFYTWDFKEPFYVTSKNQPTQNQLTLINAMTVHLKDCNLVATDAYIGNVAGRKIDNFAVEGKAGATVIGKTGENWDQYGNIVINNETHGDYTTTLYFRGSSNSIAAVFQSQYQYAPSYRGTLYLYGEENGSAALGSVWGNLDVTAKDLALTAYENAQYPDQSKYLFALFSNNEGTANIVFDNCQLDVPEKRIHTRYGTLTYQGGTRAVIGSSYHYSNTVLSGTSYLHVKGDILACYAGVSASGTSTLVVDGNIIRTYSHQGAGSTISGDATVIVKGNRFDAGYLKMTGGTVITNALVLGRQCTVSGGTIAANQIMNSPSLYSASTDDEGEYLFTSFGQCAEVTENGDNDPFTTWAQYDLTSGTFSFTGGKIYLLGYYELAGEKRYNTVLRGDSEGNPMSDIISSVVGEDGTVSALSADAALAAVERSSEDNGGNECVVLGRSDYAKGTAHYREIVISGTAEFHAAGNMTFYNDTTVRGGSITCAGTFSSKRDLTVIGGTITASEVGNAYNLTTTTDDQNTRWQKTTITGGTITADRLGALTVGKNRSTLDITGGTISSLTAGGAVTLVHDMYINYIYNADAYVNPEGNPKIVRFTGTWGNASALSEVKMKLTGDDTALTPASTDLTIEPPSLKDGSGQGSWRLDNLSGEKAAGIATDGGVLGENSVVLDGKSAVLREQIPLYATKEAYTLTIKEGGEKAASLTAGGTPIAQDDYKDGKPVNISADAQVVLTLNDSAMVKKTVVWYFDDNGVLHNAMPEIPEIPGDQISFTMPAADTEVYITDDLSLDFDRYDITFTEEGFRVEYNKTREDSTFAYEGSLTIHQSNLAGGTKITNDQGNAAAPIAPMNSKIADYLTKNRLKFEKGSGNAGEDGIERTITIQEVMQTGGSTDYGTEIADGEQVELTISGAVQLLPIHVTENTVFTATGKTGNAEDALYIYISSAQTRLSVSYGNSAGKAGAVTLDNLRLLHPYYGYLVYATQKSENPVTYKDCILEGAWVSSNGLATNMGTVTLNHCDFTINGHTAYTSPLFRGCTEAVFQNGTKINYTHGASYKAYPFFYGLQSAEIIDSEIHMGLRNSAGNAVYYEYQYNSSTAKTVTMRGASVLTSDHRLKLEKLVLNDSSGVTVGSSGVPGYLLCPDIEVNDSASVTADYVIVSGFHNPSAIGTECLTEDDFRKKAAAGSEILDGASHTGLVINGGSVTASEFAGGDVNGKVTVNGGSLEAGKIGTYGALFGYAQYIPKASGEEYVYTYAKIPAEQAAEVTVSGGTVTVDEHGCLGGMNSTVNITAPEGSAGPKVILEDGAVLGMTEEDKTTMLDDASSRGETIENVCSVNISGGSVEYSGTGSISAPYGSVVISGEDTKVTAYDLLAERGSILIKEAAEGLTNPYTGGDRKHDEVGVLIENRLAAQNVTIEDGAVVYAGGAYSDAPAGTVGSLKVASTEAKALAHLYVGEGYGPAGDGDITVDANTDGANKNVYGVRINSIRYVLNDDSVDRASNEENPSSYPVGQKNDEGETKLALADPIRSGYVFKGWYEKEDFSGTAISSLETTIQTDWVFYAKWEPVKVRFSISVGADQVPLLTDEIEGLDGTYDEENQIFTFASTVSIDYLDKMFGTVGNHIRLSDYALKSYEIAELVIDDPDYYTGATGLNAGSSVVTKAMVNAYLAKVERAEEDEKADVTIQLKAANVVKTRVQLTMNMNLNEQARPKSSEFHYTVDPEYGSSASISISSYVDIGKTIGDAKGFADENGELIRASAPGYTFGGWYLDKECTEEKKASASDVITKDSATVLYAKWTPNDYKVRFDAGEGGVITQNESEPAGGEAQTLDGIITYDQVIDGNISYADSMPADGSFPYGWTEGQVFAGWAFTDKSGNTVKVTSADELNLTDIPVLNVEPEGDEPALTLTAVYRPVQLTYHTSGGSWQDEKYGSGSGTVTVDGVYGEALAGYQKKTDEDRTEYEIVSTTAEAFKDNDNQYVEGDYRETILRKGYTFAGWYTTAEAAEKAGNGETVDAQYGPVGTVPKYGDAELYAAWTPNTYTLKLYGKDSAKTYSYTDFSYTGAAKTAEVTVGEEIKDAPAWPSRDSGNADAWYAYNKGETAAEENQKRYLLGFTFDGLDPGTTDTENSAGYQVYQTYASCVTSLLNSNNLFQKAEGTSTAGSIFQIPDTSYGNDVIPGTNTVPDYPSGAEIPMYAVYREISLVFVQYVQTDDGVEQKVMASYPWNAYVDYPSVYKTTSDYLNLTKQGYALVGWYLFASNADGTPYTESAYETNKESYKQTAKNLGTYDIMVYTVYAAQVTVENVTLTAKSDPTTTQTSSYTYTLPGSMQQGPLSYEITELEGLKLVTYKELSEHLYDSEWTDAEGVKHTADDTVAVGITLSYNGATQASSDLTGTEGQVSTLAVQAGWRITLTLYHSKVMTKEETFTFGMNFTFGDTLKDQYLKFDPMRIVLTPSVYTVIHDANLPEDDKRNVTDWADFDETTAQRTLSVPYGSALLDTVPAVEGYTADGKWYVTDANGNRLATAAVLFLEYGAPFTFAVSAENNGKVYVQTDWTVNTYKLSADDETLDCWTICYGNDSMTDSSAEVSYHTNVTFEPQNPGETAAYIFLRIGEERIRLDEYAELYGTQNDDGSFTFPMPAADVEAEYATTMGLYLENGTIEITPDGYTQNGKTVTWPGDYEILMDEENNSDGSATQNVLSLSGDLSGRTIALGNLNITSDDSIRLEEGAEVTLTTEYGGTPSTITAKNILVPENTALSMKSGEADAGTLVLTPDAAQNKAAIGGSNAANGTIDLEGLHVQMTLSGPSDASGIGSGNQTAGGSDVLLNQCEITVKEESGSGQSYKGAWIGGAGVSSVTVQGSEVNMDADSTAMVGPYVLNGKFVYVTVDSSIGTKDVPVCDPIYAEQKLTIQNSAVYQKITSNLGDVSAVGTSANGIVEVKASTIQTEASGAGQTNELYTGTMKIMDITSDVRILNTQILEIRHGSVEITDTTAVQRKGFLSENTTHTHSGSYLLLEELPPNPSNASNLTVNSLAANAVITVKQPAEASNNSAVMLYDLSVSTDVPVILDGNLKVGGTVKITADKTLSVTADEDSPYGVDFTNETPFEDKAAIYEQTNGSLKCPEKNGAAGGENLTVKLDGVTAEVHSLYAKDLTLIDSKVTADSTEGVVGSKGKTDAVTHVTIKGETNITAKTIGSLGTADETFTLVDIKDEDTFTWNGTLVRDRYRLTYEGLDDNFDNSANPLVLRTEQDSDGSKGGTEPEKVIPTIPEDPKYMPEGTSYFAVWYINAENETPTALCSEAEAETVKSEYGFTATLPGLLPEHIAYAEENDDGTSTLTVYARMLVQGTGVITAGRQFEAFDTEKTDVSVPADGAWTALFTSTGTSIADRDYQVSFEDALPKGTRLTLAVLKEDDVPEYYYQVLESASDKLLFSKFVRMGSDSETLSPGSAAAGTAEERFLLAADFAGTEAAVKEGQTVTFALAVGDSPVEIAEVTYALTDIPAGSIEASPEELSGEPFTGTVTVTPPEDGRLDGRQLILLAELTDEEGKAVSVPYGAEMALTGSDNTEIPADWIGGSRALFRLGAYGSVPGGSSYTWNLGGLEAGAYTITWKLASAEDEKDVNVLGSLLKAEEVSVTLSRAEVEPSLKVTLDLIDGTAFAGRVLAAGQSHSIGFSCSTHDDISTEVTVKAEKQNTTLASFSETSDVACAVNADKSVTVEFLSSASGTYRIRFSIAEDSEEDDVYYTFIVK